MFNMIKWGTEDALVGIPTLNEGKTMILHNKDEEEPGTSCK